jgi:hypothetical protein
MKKKSKRQLERERDQQVLETLDRLMQIAPAEVPVMRKRRVLDEVKRAELTTQLFRRLGLRHLSGMPQKRESDRPLRRGRCLTVYVHAPVRWWDFNYHTSAIRSWYCESIEEILSLAFPAHCKSDWWVSR